MLSYESCDLGKRIMRMFVIAYLGKEPFWVIVSECDVTSDDCISLSVCFTCRMVRPFTPALIYACVTCITVLFFCGIAQSLPSRRCTFYYTRQVHYGSMTGSRALIAFCWALFIPFHKQFESMSGFNVETPVLQMKVLMFSMFYMLSPVLFLQM